jgi:hypothetical protein
VSDVVEQGPDRGPRLPAWARGAALAAVLVVAAALVIPRLVSGPDPTPPDRSTQPTTAGPQQSPYVVMRVGQQIVRYDRFGVTPGPELPAGLADDGRVYVVTDAVGAARFFTVAGGRLLRIDPGRARATDLGAVTRIVDASARSGRLFVRTTAEDGGKVVTVDADSGQVVDRAPFPSDPRARGYQPVGVLSQFGVEGLVLQRTVAGEGGGEDLAVAWATAEVKAGRRPGFQAIGLNDHLLGRTGDRLLLLAGTCPGPACTLSIVSFGGDRFASRAVRPPSGWSFTVPPFPGLVQGDLVPVVPVERQPGRPTAALARLAAGGDNALLVAGTEGVVLDAGLVERDGDISFVSLGPDGSRRVLRWAPASGGRVSAFPAMPQLPFGATLVCVCDPVRSGTASTQP